MDFVVPRRARLKKPRCEVQGVSYAEQKLIEKALKQSLRDSQKKPHHQEQPATVTVGSSRHEPTVGSSRHEPLTARATGSSSSDQKPSSDHVNVAKKSATVPKAKLVTRKHHKASSPNLEDPIYRPTCSSSIPKLPPKKSIERHSKAITNIKLDLSTEDDYSSESPSPSPLPKKIPPLAKKLSSASADLVKTSRRLDSVIIISDSSEALSDWSNDGEDESFCFEATKKRNLAQDRKTDGPIQNKSVVNMPPAKKNTNDKKKPVVVGRPRVKTQKILFKAIKKSSAVAPVRVFGPHIKLEKEPFESVTAASSSDNSLNYQSPKCKRPKISTKQQHLHSPISSSPPTPKHFQAALDLSGSSRPESYLFGSYNTSSLSSDDSSDTTTSSRHKEVATTPHTSTPTKDADRNSFQAQRKFASNSAPSSLSNGFHSTVMDTEISRTIPSTEDFLLFLCLRSSGTMPDSLKFFNSPWTPRSNRHRSRLPKLTDRTLRPLSLVKEMTANIPPLR